MRRLAIIPARGGSKRIPRKNIKLFLGKPVIAYSIEAALSSNLFDEIMVSTDDVEIAEISKQHGAKVPFLRSEKNSSDHATTADVLLEVISEYEKLDGKFDLGCCLYPAAPFISRQILDESLNILNQNGADSVMPVLPFSHPIQRALKIVNGTKVQMISPENMNTRSQDLVASYHDSGQFYWFNIAKFQVAKTLWMGNCSPLILDEMHAHDIDNEEDWKIAEFKYRLLHKKL